MNLDQISPTGFILALFIRDDGERFLLGTGAYEFVKKQLHFNANEYANDVVEVQGNDGAFLAGQVRRASTQSFDGYIGDATVDRPTIENYRKAFLAFFRKNYYYKVVYVFNDGSAIQRKNGYIVDAPEVKELYQKFPEYHIALNFEDVNYYSYLEDSDGKEIYMQSAVVPVTSGVQDSGLIWDAVGVEWDAIGSEWEDTTSSPVSYLDIGSIANVYPVWEIVGPADNPQLTNKTTNTSFSYSGNVALGQTLIIDMFNKTAMLNGTSVIKNVSGDWIYFRPGNNAVVYTTQNNDSTSSTIYWQEVVG